MEGNQQRDGLYAGEQEAAQPVAEGHSWLRETLLSAGGGRSAGPAGWGGGRPREDGMQNPGLRVQGSVLSPTLIVRLRHPG